MPSHAWDAHTTDRIAARQECWRKIRPIEALNGLQLRVHRSPDPLIVGSAKLSGHSPLAAAYSAWRSNNRKVKGRDR